MRLTRRLLLAGVEAAGWDALHRLIDAGRLPTLARLVETGASGTLEPGGLAGPALWASIATGMAPAIHGITSTVELRPDGGGVQPVGVRSWRAPPVWRTLATAGVETALVGVPGLAPASAWPGICVDERYALPAGSLREDWPLLPDCISPPRLRPALRNLRLHPEELDDTALAGLPRAAVGLAGSNQAVATHIIECETWQFLAVYHGLLRASCSDAACGFIDAMLGRLIELTGPETDILVVSSAGPVIAAGPGFPVDTLLHAVTPADIAATVLARFGFYREGATGRSFAANPTGALTVLPSAAPATGSGSEVPPLADDARPVAAVMRLRAALQHAAHALAIGAYAEAEGHALAALAIDPEQPNALLLLGQAYFFLGRSAACLDVAERLMRADPDGPWAPLMKGAALIQLGHKDDAQPYLETAQRRAGDSAPVHVRLGAIMLHTGQPVAAERHYRIAAALDPTSADALAGIGLTLVAQGDAEEAERHLRLSLGLRYHTPAIHLQLALLHAGTGRWAEALSCIRTALAQQPRLPGAERLRRQIETRLAAALARDARSVAL
ncbi:MAG: tetratricopeptide repeat protein [Alphaproteobacteria bacterium]